ncbi:MAG: C-GCAxxG-C-C family (seleno)protein, partial [Desulfotomaculales bacterium]
MEIDAGWVGEQVNSLFGKGYFCSKITAIILQDILGCPSDEVIKAMSSFSGGVGRNGTSCGALNGALA